MHLVGFIIREYIHMYRHFVKIYSSAGLTGDRGSTMVKVLCYKSEGH